MQTFVCMQNCARSESAARERDARLCFLTWIDSSWSEWSGISSCALSWCLVWMGRVTALSGCAQQRCSKSELVISSFAGWSEWILCVFKVPLDTTSVLSWASARIVEERHNSFIKFLSQLLDSSPPSSNINVDRRHYERTVAWFDLYIKTESTDHNQRV